MIDFEDSQESEYKADVYNKDESSKTVSKVRNRVLSWIRIIVRIRTKISIRENV